MSDIDTSAPSSPGTADSPTGGEGSVTPPAPTPPAGGFDTIDYDDIEQAAANWNPEKARGELGRLRGEHAKYRERYQPYAKAFEKYSPDDQQVLLQVVEAMADPNRAVDVAHFLIGTAKNLAGDQYPDVYGQFAPEQAQPSLPDSIPTDPAEFEKFLEERAARVADEKLKAFQQEQQQAQAQQQSVAQIDQSLRDLGYDPDSVEAEFVCQLALRNHNNDLQAAHEAFQQQQQEWARKAVENRAPNTAPPAPQAAPGRQADPNAPRKTGHQKLLERARAGNW